MVEEKKEVCPKTSKPPSKAKPRSGKMVFCKIHLLDGQLYETDVTKNATGKELFDKVCAYLTLQEKDYFGLQYQNNNVKFWLNNEKKILKQVKGGTSVFDFSVKFYPPEPLAMLEDLSRFQLCLQVRFDIFNGKLPCSFTTLAVVGSYMVQAEVGDYDNIDEYEFGPGDSYLDKIEYAPNKSPEMRSKVYELHKTHKGLTPEEAELQYLENAKKLAMYGVDLHQARDSTGVKLMLGVCASGIQVYKDKLRINRFVWPAILKLSYKRNNFYVKKRPTENEKDGETIGFKLENHKMAKRLWKTCVEHHAFFRLHQSDPPKSSTFPRFNSKFRYSGRTQKQVRDEVEKIENKPKFDRTHFKYSSMPQTNNTEGYNHGYPDEKDRTDQKGVTTPSTESGPPPYFTDSQGPDGYNTLESSADKPNSLGNMSEDRTDRTPGHEDATQDWSPGAGDAATLEAQRRGKKSKEDKEREKKEKEEEKRRKKEEEKERKRLEKERKQGKGAEDRTDKMGDESATLGLNGEHHPGSAGLDSVGLGMDGDMINRVLPEGEGSIDRRMQFIPVTPPVQETKDSLKGHSNSTMPFFDSASGDTLGKKVPPPVPPKGMRNGFSEEDRSMQDMPPTIPTESFTYENNTDDIPISTKNVPFVKTKTQTVTYEKDGYPYETEDGILISSQSHSTRSQTIETTTYKTEKDGKVETRVEKKVVITDEGDDDDLDHDDLLAEAIRSVTEMNPDLSVERIECMRQIEEVEK
ncbi:erythrocyte membrane protein band 4.1 [Mytilus galloprovincialis]|uniref:Erythrocyte membrane protein band 4.1 n=1 Tax=Mytilus galloprovincialis TaxID=29158 RepID=A0A8B6FUT5_MYTGA|nr:erythrocyte membrane protein band 4.1 [Mytilus galloprovincialis]